MNASGDLQSNTSSAAMNGASLPAVPSSPATEQAVPPSGAPTPMASTPEPTASAATTAEATAEVTAEVTTATSTATSPETQASAREIGKWWWAWIVAGVLWIIASFAILRFGAASVALVGIVIGVMVLAAGIQDIVIGALAGGWKWLWFIVGGLLIVGGLVMLFNPTKTFLVTSSILGFIFLLVGVFWIVEAFATLKVNPVWWLGLIAGIMMLGLGFWASGQFFIVQAYSLLVFAGIWALLHGITDIVKAFQIKRLGSLPAADISAI